IILPSFVESHIHLDTVLTAGNPTWNESGTLLEGIKIWGERKRHLTKEDVKQRATQVIKQLITNGVLFIRSHVDISDPHLTALHALLELREQFSKHITIQLVAFPQDGILSCPGNIERLEKALELGVDAVGAIPHNEHTREAGVRSLEISFSLVKKYEPIVNVFCDETDDAESRFLEVVADVAIENELYERVTASHVNAMSHYSEAYVAKLMQLLQRSRVNIVVCPLVSSVMQSRLDTWPKGRGIARVKDLWQAGVNVSIGHDDIMTPFYPVGTGNMLQAAHLALHVAHMSGVNEMEELIQMITSRGAKTLQIDQTYGLAEGQLANINVIKGKHAIDLIQYQPKCSYVISKGSVIATSKQVESELYV